MVTSNEKYEQEINAMYLQDVGEFIRMGVASEGFLEEEKRASAYNSVLTEVQNRNVSFRALAQIAIDVLSDLELYELTAILNKHQKEKYEASI